MKPTSILPCRNLHNLARRRFAYSIVVKIPIEKKKRKISRHGEFLGRFLFDFVIYQEGSWLEMLAYLSSTGTSAWYRES